MKTKILTLIMIVVACLTLQAQYDTTLSHDYNQTLVIPDLAYGSTYIIGKKNGGEFRLKPSDYETGQVGWNTPNCGAPMIDSLTSCGAGPYTLNYKKNSGVWNFVDIYIRYFVDIIDSTPGSPSYGQHPDTIWINQGETATLSASTEFASTRWYFNDETNVLSYNYSISIQDAGRYRIRCNDGDYFSFDTIVVALLTPCNPDLITINTEICEGESYFAQGVWQTTSGTYYDTLFNSCGADSVIVTNLTVNLTHLTTIDTVICYGTIYTFPNNTSVNIYSDTSHVVHLTSVWGCDSVIATNITIISLPILSLSNDTLVCSGSTIMLSATSNGNYYLWSNGETTNAISVSILSDTTFYVWSGNNCGIAIDSITVTLFQEPLIDLGADQFFCWGQSIILNPGSGNFASYEWSTGATTATISVDTTGTYWVYIIDNNGCSGRDTVLITALLPTPEEVCYVEFDTVTWKNNVNWTSMLPGNADSVKIYKEISLDVWDLLGTVNSLNTNFIDITSNPQLQSYSYKIAVIDTCGNESNMSQHHTTITLLSNYDNVNDTYDFTWSAYQGLTVSDYFLFGIDASNVVTQIATVPGNIYMYNYVNPSTNYVKYFVGFETPVCGAKSNVIVKSNWVQSVVTGIEKFESASFSVFPNPANEKIEIKTDLGKYEIELINIFGQVLLKEKNATEINVGDYAPGTYILRINGENFTSQEKIIVY